MISVTNPILTTLSYQIYTAIARTPQGILKSREERPDKSKRVIFSLDNSEDEEDPLERKKKSPKVFGTVRLPNKIIPVKPTVRASPKLFAPTTPKANNGDRYKISEVPGKRAKRAESEEHAATGEMDKFKMLFPDQEDEKKAKQVKDKTAAKKTPFKSKIKKVVPRGKKTSTKEKVDLSWFDSDSVFGFGMEE